MEIKRIKARNIDGENGIFVNAGNLKVSFNGVVEEPSGEKKEYAFVVEGVEDSISAVRMADYYYCGYLDTKSVKNIEWEELK